MAAYSKKVTPEHVELSELCRAQSTIDHTLYAVKDVKRGLRDLNGNGVVAGLTQISEINAFRYENGRKIPIEGELFYRGIPIEKLTSGFIDEKRYGFEEATYLLLFGSLPNEKQLKDFRQMLVTGRSLPTNFTRDVIMKAPSKEIMNSLAKSVLTLASYDKYADDTSLENVLRQCVNLIATFPMLAVYAYQAYNHYELGHSLYIHNPSRKLGTAENILRMLRPDKKYTEIEARVLDLALVLHMEHGGGNNSTFTMHVVTSSGTDTYSAVAASLASLKGPKHGGANIKVVEMIRDLKSTLADWTDEGQVADYLTRLLNKEAFDRAGLIYGMGHAIYSISDPRERVLRTFVQSLAEEKGRDKDLKLYQTIEDLAPRIIAGNRPIYKGVSPNVDFYSGFLYELLDIPMELYTPLFAIARIVGWSAHRIEELVGAGKIIRPAYKSIIV